MDNASSFGFARRLSKARNQTDRELGQAQRRNNERPKRHWRALKEWKMKWRTWSTWLIEERPDDQE
ncbi:hypothetical protein L195_g063231, partial [Trifolium pratense]